MTVAVLDASALLALLLGERVAETVRAVLDDCSMSVANIGEVVGYYACNGVSASDIRLALDQLPVERILLS